MNDRLKVDEHCERWAESYSAALCSARQELCYCHWRTQALEAAIQALERLIALDLPTTPEGREDDA